MKHYYEASPEKSEIERTWKFLKCGSPPRLPNGRTMTCLTLLFPWKLADENKTQFTFFSNYRQMRLSDRWRLPQATGVNVLTFSHWFNNFVAFLWQVCVLAFIASPIQQTLSRLLKKWHLFTSSCTSYINTDTLAWSLKKLPWSNFTHVQRWRALFMASHKNDVTKCTSLLLQSDLHDLHSVSINNNENTQEERIKSPKAEIRNTGL